MKLRSILVPLDGSTFGEHALPYALSLARRAGVGVELAHVRDPILDPEVNLARAEEQNRLAVEQAWGYLNRVVQQVKSAWSVPVRASLLRGPISGALCEFVAQCGANLIVLTSHGRGPLSQFWLGSVATDLIQRAPAPVLLIRPKEETPQLATEPSIQRILIPLDGSAFGQHIIPAAVAIGQLTQARYRLFQVVSPIQNSSWSWFASDLPPQTDTQQLEVEATNYLRSVTAQHPELAGAETRVSSDWPPAPTILREAEAYAADLIALETHGRGGLMRLLLGSVADKIVRSATQPLLLRRPPGS
jgi:nucleotide-binding universal stress UspA family protein